MRLTGNTKPSRARRFWRCCAMVAVGTRRRMLERPARRDWRKRSRIWEVLPEPAGPESKRIGSSVGQGEEKTKRQGTKRGRVLARTREKGTRFGKFRRGVSVTFNPDNNT